MMCNLEKMGAMPTLVVGMTRRDSLTYMLAVSLRSLSKHGTHKSPSG
jgi:predicted transcriptional regulator